MNYLSYLNIKHFKGIENLELKDLSNINIIVGNNNSGKTSLLEAISLLQSQDSMKTMLKHISRRDTTYPTRFELFLEIFPKEQETSKSIQINSTINGLNRQLKIDGKLDKEIFKGNLSIKLDDKKLIKKDMVFKQSQVIRDSSSYDIIKIIYITPYDHFKDGLINKTIENIKESDKDKIISLLQMFDSNILDFKVLYTDNKENPQTTYINHKRYGFMPLFSFGDSIKKVLTLASAVISAKGGILLVDEIETAIHKNMINEVFKWFIDACEEFEVQLICTTHSLEAIDGMIIALEDEIDILSCFRVELYEEKVYGTKFSGNKLKEIRTLLGQDVR
jgi:AAA15 family ATPase/GTPase